MNPPSPPPKLFINNVDETSDESDESLDGSSDGVVDGVNDDDADGGNGVVDPVADGGNGGNDDNGPCKYLILLHVIIKIR